MGGENNKNQKAIQYVVAHSPPVDNLPSRGARREVNDIRRSCKANTRK